MHELISEKLVPIKDSLLSRLENSWYAGPQRSVSNAAFVPMADEWFKSTRLNNLQNWNQFPCADVIMGCTHFIENLVVKHGLDGIQILPEEYAYYGLLGKHGTCAGNLEQNKPLIISLPSWRYADLRPEWPDILKECEEKNIDIHIDFAWLTVARNIDIDLGHPCIKSFGMSMSKYALEWNRVGLRWCRQRTMDSITMFNHYHGNPNNNVISCGAFMMQNIPRDHGWITHGKQHYNICAELDLVPTKIIHVALNSVTGMPCGIGRLFGESAPDHV